MCNFSRVEVEQQTREPHKFLSWFQDWLLLCRLKWGTLGLALSLVVHMDLLGWHCLLPITFSFIPDQSFVSPTEQFSRQVRANETILLLKWIHPYFIWQRFVPFLFYNAFGSPYWPQFCIDSIVWVSVWNFYTKRTFHSKSFVQKENFSWKKIHYHLNTLLFTNLLVSKIDILIKALPNIYQTNLNNYCFAVFTVDTIFRKQMQMSKEQIFQKWFY